MANAKLFCAVGLVLLLPACAKKSAPPRTAPMAEATEEMALAAEHPYRGIPLPAPPPDAPVVGDVSAVQASTDETTATEATATEAAGAAPLTDAQILGVTEQLNSDAIAQARLARERAQTTSVKAFADHLLSQHSKAQRDSATLAKESRLLPEPSGSAVDVSAHGEAALAALTAADPVSFDRAYVGTQIDQHQSVLRLLDERLIPDATDPVLRAQLQQARSMSTADIAEARKVQQTLLAASGQSPAR